jgi:hypothetical protein
MKSSRLVFLTALCCACPAAASPAGDIGGTWECRQPGVQYNNKPPILYIADAQGTVDVDGFSREVYGRSEMTSDQDGWWKVKPAQGLEFTIRPEAAPKPGTAAMALRLAGGKADYHCLRLPPTATTGLPAPATPSVLPAAEVSPATEPQGGATPEAPAAPMESPAYPPAQEPSDAAPAPKTD